MADRSPWQVAPDASLHLASIPTDGTPDAPGDKDETNAATAELLVRLAELQDRLWAEGSRSLLVVLQAMDAGGKDGTVKHVFSGVNPSGVRVTSFKVPSEEERGHDFLWRVHKATPVHGEMGIFNRSHYEDVLIVRVNDLVPEKVWRPRYEQIRHFEEQLCAGGTTVVKLFLHISKAEQAERFQARLDDPAKNWKFSKADLDVRARWDDYQSAYAEAIERTSTAEAPWFVIPADRKWYRNWAVSRILVDALERMDPHYPDPEPGLDQITIT